MYRASVAQSVPSGIRRTLRQKIRDLGLHITHSVEAKEDDLP
jgi:hypothetical protein